MHNNGTVILQPTTLTMKQAPSVIASANFSNYPNELTIVLRHIPQPEHLGKVSNRINYNTYHAFLINTVQDTKTFLGTIDKLRSGTYRIISQNIPSGYWDRLIISLAPGGSLDLGLPLFEASGDYAVEIPATERFSTLPADVKINVSETRIYTNDVLNPDHETLIQPGTVLPEPVDLTPFNQSDPSLQEDNSLLQPGTVLPENILSRKLTHRCNPPSDQHTTPIDAPHFFNLDPPPETQPGQFIQQISLPQLPNHACWLVNYHGYQLVGYVFDPLAPKKPLYIIHGIPGNYSIASKPTETGYDYWIVNPQGDGGYWLRYTTPIDDIVMYPFPVTSVPKT